MTKETKAKKPVKEKPQGELDQEAVEKDYAASVKAAGKK